MVEKDCTAGAGDCCRVQMIQSAFFKKKQPFGLSA